MADGLIFFTFPSAAVPVVTARVACAVWTVQMGLVVRVVIEPIVSSTQGNDSLPATSPAIIPSEVVRAAALVADPALRRSSKALISSS
jgi:hypothetical protein